MDVKHGNGSQGRGAEMAAGMISLLGWSLQGWVLKGAWILRRLFKLAWQLQAGCRSIREALYYQVLSVK